MNTIKKESTEARKNAFVDILRANGGNIKQSCIKANMGRSTYYGWIDDDKEFENEVRDVNEELLDFTESQLMKHITKGNLTAIIFYLKTKGQSRGYIEKQYINQKQMTTPIKIFEFSRDEIVIK
jgi:hypothetical protein|tara:strand:- start:85 stop:456 length:372 start_codon:yes stop_codon:yes gene_type:complete